MNFDVAFMVQILSKHDGIKFLQLNASSPTVLKWIDERMMYSWGSFRKKSISKSDF